MQRIGHILKEEGIINDKALDFCLSVQQNSRHERLGKVLKDYDFVSDQQMAKALAKQAGLELYDGSFVPCELTIASLGEDFLRQHMIFPAKEHDGVVFVVAYGDESGVWETIGRRIKAKPVFRIACEAQLRRHLEKLTTPNNRSATGGSAVENLPLWFEQCLNDAIRRRATDIHIEPSQRAVEVRFRIDGILHFYKTLQASSLGRLVNIIFHKAEVSVSDFSRFHDARFTHKHALLSVDVRVSHIPCIHGSSVVLRLLDKDRSSISLTDLGYPQQEWSIIESALKKPEGMVLTVGPTGCGKTTTLYALLNHIKGIERKILTIEDPVEMQIPLLTQVQTNEKRDITFGSAIRSFLRHDPNVILIGEIRDGLTAQEAMRAAMTGHKVLATLHANGCVDALLRLNDLGVPYAHMASNVSLVIVQRLIRSLCEMCKKPAPGGFLPVGCEFCLGGYHGRRVVADVLACDEAVMDYLLEKDLSGLKKHMNAIGQKRSMRMQAQDMVNQGLTTAQEVQRVIG